MTTHNDRPLTAQELAEALKPNPCKHGYTMPAGMDCRLCAIEKAAKQKAERVRKRKANPYEMDIQRKCVGWFRKEYPDVVITSHRNEMKQTEKHHGAVANMNGRHTGIADLQVIAIRCGYGGLFIEMKRPKTGKTDEKAQLEFAAYCVRAGYRYAMCDNVEDFKEIVTNYLG